MKAQFGIRSLEESLKTFRETWKALERRRGTTRRVGIPGLEAGKKAEAYRKIKARHIGTYFTSLEAARKALTPKRLELLRAIRQESPAPLARLAKVLGRDLKDVQEDVRALVDYGLVSLRKARSASGRDIAIPRVRVKEIEFRIAV